MFIANRMTDAERTMIATSELWHYSKATYNQLLAKRLHGVSDQFDTEVRLTAESGYQFDLNKFVRDVAVWDVHALTGSDFGKYVYFFFGKPSEWTRRLNVQAATLTIRVSGSALLAQVPEDRLFYRSLDKVVVIRGEYLGPAMLDPALPAA